MSTRAVPSTSGTHGASKADPLRPYLLPGILFVAALMLYTWRLWVPERYMFDEVYHAYTAGQYAVGNADAYVWYTHAPREHVAYMWNHPPAGLLLIAAGIRVFGDDSFGWRIASALFGAIGVLVAYLMAFRLTRRREVAILTAIFLLADSLYFVQSRIAMLDIFGVVFMTGALWSFYGFLCAPTQRVAGPLMRTGLFLGLAVATKWNAVYAGVLLGLVATLRTAALALAARRGPAESDLPGLRAHLLAVPLGLVLVPALIYLAAYIPFFLVGHDLSQWVELQKQIFYYHSRLRDTHPYQSHWWGWPLTLRPVWYYATYVGDGVAHIYANGNSILYVAFVPAVLWTCVRWWTTDRRAMLVLAIGFFGQWLPWMLVPRISFIYHFLPSAVFGCVAVAWVMSELRKLGRWGRALALGYVTLVVASFAFFFPIRAAVLLSPHAVDQRMWLKSWR